MDTGGNAGHEVATDMEGLQGETGTVDMGSESDGKSEENGRRRSVPTQPRNQNSRGSSVDSAKKCGGGGGGGAGGNDRRTEKAATDKDDERLFSYNAAEQEAALSSVPWSNNPNYFKRCRISAMALTKMVAHAHSGGRIEIMGVMKGKIEGDAFVILDSFALPVEGTETRVNAGAQANEYMVNFQEASERLGNAENICGWYHSHPGYGCWLSGIDVQTQTLYQTHQEPFVAVVIDPIRTCSSGRVDIGAFRTYPASYTPSADAPSESQVPLSKIEDFGLHWKQYYSLEVNCFKSSQDSLMLDLLWKQYWASTLSSSSLIANKQYHNSLVEDFAGKLERMGDCPMGGVIGGHSSRFRSSPKRGSSENDLCKIAKEGGKAASEQLQGMASQVVKTILFAPLATESSRRDEKSCGCCWRSKIPLGPPT